MTNRPRKQTNVFLVFQVLHFVNQLRRRVQPRVQKRSNDNSRVGSKLDPERLALRRISERLSRLGAHDAKQPQRIANRISKCRKKSQKFSRSVHRLRVSDADSSDGSNNPGDEVQQYVKRSFRLVSSTELPA